MSRKSSQPPPAKMGRPVTIGATTLVGVKFPPAQIEAVDTWGKSQGFGRSEAVRQLVDIGLHAVQRSAKRKAAKKG